ncbi:hypothetical protein ACFSLT_04190 [Novosphingobium resinovorum]
MAIERHHYSVPHRFARREVEARFTASTVEIFLGGERIAVHLRSSGNGGTPPSPSTCHPATGATANGRWRKSGRRQAGSGRCYPCWSRRSSRQSPIPNRAIDPVWASSGSKNASVPSASKLRRCARWRSRRAITRRLNRSSRRASTRCPFPNPRARADHPFQHPRLELLQLKEQEC